MEVQTLQKWSNLLLDTGKGNRLVNFKVNLMTMELIYPHIGDLYKKIELDARFRVLDEPITKNRGNHDDTHDTDDWVDFEEISPKNRVVRLTRDEYITAYQAKAKKGRDFVMVYNGQTDPIVGIQRIRKKGLSAIEETGVNILYLAFGFINWREDEHSDIWMKAPILLVPVAIENESAIDPFFIRVLEDEVTVNPTFAFKMLTEYGVKMPEMEDDEDMDAYFDRIQERFADTKLQWTVDRSCYLGTFSFLKINMYQDLKENAEAIAASPNVSALTDCGVGVPHSGGEGGRRGEKAVQVLHNVVDADSSQSEAIEMMKRGKSFVLQGPPGTGKSQTITNMIAECLADGKTVLFVSEKLAALSVVYAKLKAAGLEEFCLELHSHKANKKQVIEELHRTLIAPKTQVSGTAKKELEAMREAQRKLDEYAEELHRVRPVIGTTLYHLCEQYAACRDIDTFAFPVKRLKTKGEKHLDNVLNALTKYAGYTASVGYDYRKNVWYGYRNPDNSYEATVEIQSELETTVTLFTELQDMADDLQQKYSMDCRTYEQMLGVKDIFAYLQNSVFATPALLSRNDIATLRGILVQMQPLAQVMVAQKTLLDEWFDQDVYGLDGKELYKSLTIDFEKFFSRLLSKEYKQLMLTIRRCKKNGKKSSYEEAILQMDALTKFQSVKTDFDAFSLKVEGLFGTGYQGYETNFDALISDLQSLETLNRAAVSLGNLLTMPTHDFEEERSHFAAISEHFVRIFSQSQGAEKSCMAKFDATVCSLASMDVGAVARKCQDCYDNIDRLDNWLAFTQLLAELKKLDVLDFIHTSMQEMVNVDLLADTFKKIFLGQWIDAIIRDSNLMYELSRVSHDDSVRIFKEKDVLSFEINKAYIRSAVQARRPSLDFVVAGSAISILRHEAGKKRKQKGIRQLLGEIKDLALTIKPCFLMSPLSVSTFLTADMKFDVVIFDEASQIFPQDAIGSIYRGKQLIVVGDTKQMPPSNFFSADIEIEDDDSDDNLTNYESILDMCAVTYPECRLKWHYRSRFEQLISFSNRNFYENTLVTFPSAKADGLDVGVDYVYVDGVFDRKSKTNREEAERIVDMVFEHYEKHPERSLGVVAFSVSQQELIERLIDKRRAADHSKEDFFKSDREEPFFVKNLESVQGDERDTIIFSVAYARDAQDRLYMNFGPINKSGGERRLNVAFTRAKYNVKLVTFMHYTDIDLSKTQAWGTKLLREYLDFAENGMVALERAVDVNAFDQHDSDFEEEVCEFLRDNGYQVDTQVGCSAFRIDMALKNPNTSDYVLAIECDGATYHSSKNARDRDRLRQTILENMGWKFYRIWSTDWFRNKRVEKEELLKAVKRALEESPMSMDTIQHNDFSFEEKVEERHFVFPVYPEAQIASIVSKYRDDVQSMVKAILQTEAPLSEDWLLKRMSRMVYDRMKVTGAVWDRFNQDMQNCERIGIIRKDGFMYLKGVDVPMLRVPKEKETPIRNEIKYICLEELAYGIKKIIEENVSVEKSNLYRLIAQLLGFGHVGDAIIHRLDEALALIEQDIDIDGDMLSIK